MASYILLVQIKSPYTSCSLFISGAIFLYQTIMFSKSFLFSTLFSLFYQKYHWPPDSSLLSLQHGYCFSFPWPHVIFPQLWITRWEFSPEHSYVFPFHMPLVSPSHLAMEGNKKEVTVKFAPQQVFTVFSQSKCQELADQNGFTVMLLA